MFVCEAVAILECCVVFRQIQMFSNNELFDDAQLIIFKILARAMQLKSLLSALMRVVAYRYRPLCTPPHDAMQSHLPHH